MIREMDVRKAVGPDRVVKWILRECEGHVLVGPVHDIIKVSTTKNGQ